METEAEKQLAALVGMRTVSSDIAMNHAALDYIQNYLSDRGMHCSRKTYNGRSSLIAGSRPNNGLTPTVLLSGHVDVVGGSDKVFTLRREADKLIGRGVWDMKFSIAGYMQLVDDLKDKLGDYDFSIIVTIDEEISGKDGIGALVENGLKPKVCILPDSTAPNWSIETIAKGNWRFELTAIGKSSHGSRPWDGDSATVKLLDALNELRSWFVGQNIATNSFNIGTLRAGVPLNQTPDKAVAGIDIRFINEQSHDEIKQKIENLCKKFNLTTKTMAFYMPVYTNLTDPIIEPYLKSVKKITNKMPQAFTSCATTDAPFLVAKGVPCIISCPKGGAHHSENEWISRESFLHFVPILKDYLDQVAKI